MIPNTPALFRFNAKRVAHEASKHARTQTRYKGPNRLATWHCDCGQSGTSANREAAVRDHRAHVEQKVLEVLDG